MRTPEPAPDPALLPLIEALAAAAVDEHLSEKREENQSLTGERQNRPMPTAAASR